MRRVLILLLSVALIGGLFFALPKILPDDAGRWVPMIIAALSPLLVVLIFYLDWVLFRKKNIPNRAVRQESETPEPEDEP